MDLSTYGATQRIRLYNQLSSGYPIMSWDTLGQSSLDWMRVVLFTACVEHDSIGEYDPYPRDKGNVERKQQ